MNPADLHFVIVGAPKCGTTTLYDRISRCDGVILPADKEGATCIIEATSDHQLRNGLNELLPYRGTGGLVGACSVQLLYFERCVPRLLRLNPDLKIIALLRNPVNRAYSHYWHGRREGYESGTFEEAIKREARYLGGGTLHDQMNRTYVAHGYYARQLRPFITAFGMSRMWIRLTEELRAAPDEVLRDLFEFLDLPPPRMSFSAGDSNASSMPRWPLVTRIMKAPNASYKRIYRQFMPSSFRRLINERVLEPLDRINRAPFDYPPMGSATRKRLQEHYRPHNERLEALLNRDLSVWQS